MSEELKDQQPQDDRPEYEPPRALRLGDVHTGTGPPACTAPGSGEAAFCTNGPGAGDNCGNGSGY
jgi:hypothetical protein